MKCPFLDNENNDGIWMDCIEEECEVWNPEKNICGLSTNKSDADDIVQSIYEPAFIRGFSINMFGGR